jgi:hypothetical protein
VWKKGFEHVIPLPKSRRKHQPIVYGPAHHHPQEMLD